MKRNLSLRLAAVCALSFFLDGHVRGAAAPRTSTADCFQEVKEITLEGEHTPREGHLQGLATDKRHVYWSFSRKLVKTDLQGDVAASRDVAFHHGDLAYHDGRIYVSFVQKGISKVLIYDTKDLSLVETHDINVFEDYIGTLEYYDDHFYLGEDFYQGMKNLKVHKFDMNFRFIKTYTIDKKLKAGFENIARFADCW